MTVLDERAVVPEKVAEAAHAPVNFCGDQRIGLMGYALDVTCAMRPKASAGCAAAHQPVVKSDSLVALPRRLKLRQVHSPFYVKS